MRIIFAILTIVLFECCSKKYLTSEVSSQYQLADNLKKLEGILNNTELMGQTPVMGEESSDDHYLIQDYYNNMLPIQDKNIYTWEKDIYAGKTGIRDWNIPYQQIFTCNSVLDGLSKITPDEMTLQQWRLIKASALFLRSFAFYNIAQIFANAYDETTAGTAPGVAMPLEADIEKIPARSSMRVSYQKIIDDLLTALPLAPDKVQKSKLHLASKPAVFGLLARVYLSMQDYPNARKFADSSLGRHALLIDYNTLNVNAEFPISASNDEVLYRSWLMSTSLIIRGKAMYATVIDSLLYNMYDNNDLRKNIFFMGNAKAPIFRSNYSGLTNAFSGLASDEMYLIRAECNVRLNDTSKGMAALRQLLKNRYKNGTLPPLQILSKEEALDLILKERRKELTFRGLRWIDLKRLNMEKKEKADLMPTRFINGQIHQLLPNSNKYAMPVPDDALSGNVISQNNRD